MMRTFRLSSVVFGVAMFVSANAYADDYVITLKSHQFSPQELVIPTGQKIKVTVKNMDATPAEFESTDLNREKLVSGNSEIIVFIGPLDAGSYVYFDDFNHDTTKATITAK